MSVARDDSLTIRPLARDDLGAVVAIDAALEGRPRRAYVERRLPAAVREPELHAQFAASDGSGLAGYMLARVLLGEFGRTDPGLRLEMLGRADDLDSMVKPELVEEILTSGKVVLEGIGTLAGGIRATTLGHGRRLALQVTRFFWGVRAALLRFLNDHVCISHFTISGAPHWAGSACPPAWMRRCGCGRGHQGGFGHRRGARLCAEMPSPQPPSVPAERPPGPCTIPITPTRPRSGDDSA